jgi:rhamnogalacturonyl hydrolase YesR
MPRSLALPIDSSGTTKHNRFILPSHFLIMKTPVSSLHILISCLTATVVATSTHAADPAPADVASAIKRSADWHLSNPSGIDTRDWIIAPLYDGLIRTSLATGDPKYLAEVVRFGTQSGWMAGNRKYHADDHAVGHAWIDIYQMDPSRKERLAPMKARIDDIIANPITEKLQHGKKPSKRGVSVSDRWTWCDALYMAPPTLSRLHKVTGDEKYLRFLDQEYRYTYDHLYDPEEHLFFRDANYFKKKTPAGTKTFWSRGNGWVYGGLPLLLESLPADDSTRRFYENLFKEMTGAVVAAQQPDGLWHPSMLDPNEIPLGETSGSGFFIYGLAWGVNNGLLDRETYWPVITRGWAGLMTRIKPDGYVGYVQPVGSAPAPLGPESIQDYGTGAFLLAGSELLRALGGASDVKPATLLAAAEKLLAEEAKIPRAYARLVPERMGDVAWENDKVAFRVYGPPLRDKPEDSGIDAWCKKVPYPVIDKWYRQDLTQKISYHKDHGEGFDGFKVGDTRGCGGLGLLVKDKLVTADVYKEAEILWSGPDVAEFRTIYQYPLKVNKKPVFEYRVTKLRQGSRFSEINSIFTHEPSARSRGKKPIKNFPHEVAIGLTTQDKAAKADTDAEHGFISVYSPFPGGDLGTAVLVDPAKMVRTYELPATDKERNNRQLMVVVRPSDDAGVSYRTGFAWAADGEITTHEQWLEHLRKTP